MLMRVPSGRGGGALPKLGFSRVVARVLALFLFFSLSVVAQVITFTNKAVTFTTLEGTVYRSVNLVKADPCSNAIETGWYRRSRKRLACKQSRQQLLQCGPLDGEYRGYRDAQLIL